MKVVSGRPGCSGAVAFSPVRQWVVLLGRRWAGCSWLGFCWLMYGGFLSGVRGFFSVREAVNDDGRRCEGILFGSLCMCVTGDILKDRADSNLIRM